MEPVELGPLTLVGLRVHPEQIVGRQLLWVESYWTAATPPDADYWISTRLVSPEGRSPTWLSDHEPCDWAWPTSRWKPGIIYRDYHGVRPPPKLSEASMELELGVQRLLRDGYKLQSVGQPHRVGGFHQSPQ
jgi:hypothetical protein